MYTQEAFNIFLHNTIGCIFLIYRGRLGAMSNTTLQIRNPLYGENFVRKGGGGVPLKYVTYFLKTKSGVF